MSDWRPIETAPKDGELILALNHGQARVMYYAEDPGEWRVVRPRSSTTANPTHWLSIPEPPK